MSTIFAVFVYISVTLAVLALEFATRTNMLLRLFGYLKATMGGSGRILYSLEFFFDGCPMLTNGVEAFSQTGMVCEDTRGYFAFLFFFVLK
jgi:hypothetical protein